LADYAVDGICAAVGTVFLWKVAQWIVDYRPASSGSPTAEADPVLP